MVHRLIFGVILCALQDYFGEVQDVGEGESAELLRNSARIFFFGDTTVSNYEVFLELLGFKAKLTPEEIKEKIEGMGKTIHNIKPTQPRKGKNARIKQGLR